ncbi:unannotated protein [freshwater metagenome]|uniref:Unannotated protein n=1 Tax=freshwater metagenome TaxID=449393 RepID=A0A6J7UKE4_9ZZZZ
MAFTSSLLTGNNRSAVSLITSVKTPPTPIVNTRPSGDGVMPTNTSTPLGTNRSTSTDASPPFAIAISRSKTSGAPSSEISNATPPASLLCNKPGITAFNTARPPTFTTAALTSLFLETTSDSGTGTPTLSHKFFSSTSLAPAFGVAVASTSGFREYFGIGSETTRNNSSARAARSGVG